MEVIRQSSEDEMVAAFLKAEIGSARWRPLIEPRLARCGVTMAMLENPDLTDADRNERRARLLSEYRGWGRNAYLFRGWPEGLSWSISAIGPEDVPHLRYANADEWRQLSQNTWLPSEGARRIARGDPTIRPDVPVDAIRAIAIRIQEGESLAPVIAIGTPKGNPIVFVEGHSRITAYLVVGLPERLPIIYGAAPLTRLMPWQFYPERR